MRTVFMGSPRFALPSLERLVQESHEVVAVYTQPDRPAGRGKAPTAPPVKEAALRLGIPVFQPDSLRSAGAISRLKDIQADVFVVCAYGQILPAAVLEMPPYGCINVHFSLLPRHRGAAPVAASILAGDDFTGVSILLLEKRLDAGPLLATAPVPVQPWDNTGSLAEKLAIVGASLLLEALSRLERGETRPRPQDEAAATYCRELKKEAGKIDWGRTAEEIWRQVRAYNPWPGGYTTWNGRQLKIIESNVLPCLEDPGQGRVVVPAGGEEAFGVGTGRGVLGVTRVQLEGKRAMTAVEFLRGQRDFIGSLLPS